jgi:hypothetical protein
MTGRGQHIRERRQTERKHLVYYLRVFDGPGAKVLGHIVNISAGGVMLLGDTVIPPNWNYHLRMKYPAMVTDRDDILFTATSRWCHKDTEDLYITGLEIHDLLIGEKRDLLCLIEDFSFIEQ